MARKSASPGVILAIGILMHVAGLALLVWQVGVYREQERAATAYEQTEGTVVAATVRRHTRKGKADHWFVDRTYRYEVGGRSFESDKVAHTTSSYADRESARRIADGSPPGSKVPVWYDPADPARAVLDRSPPSVGVLLMPLAVAAAGVFVILLSRRRAAAAASGATAG